MTSVALPRSKVPRLFFHFALLVLALQLISGLVAAAQYVWPAFLADAMPFNMARLLHINALIVWLLAGFMG